MTQAPGVKTREAAASSSFRAPSSLVACVCASTQTHNCTGVHGEAEWESTRGKVGAFGCEDGIRIVYGNGRTVFLPSETRVGCEC